MNSLNAFLAAMKTWMETLGRPVFYEDVPGSYSPDIEVLPVLTISLYGRAEPELESLDAVVARWVGVTFTSVGRNVVDALWLDAKVMELLTGALPDLAVDVVYLGPEPAAALRAAPGRMLAEHRAACAYR